MITRSVLHILFSQRKIMICVLYQHILFLTYQLNTGSGYCFLFHPDSSLRECNQVAVDLDVDLDIAFVVFAFEYDHKYQTDGRVTLYIKKLSLQLFNLIPHSLHLSCNWITIHNSFVLNVPSLMAYFNLLKGISSCLVVLAVKNFNAHGSDDLCFLLSTRAGGLDSELRRLSDLLRTKNEELKSKWETEKLVLGEVKDKAEKKFHEITEQNKILHDQLEALPIKVAGKNHGSSAEFFGLLNCSKSFIFCSVF
ncbi:Tetratricopeptide, MLP1/MLP2-like protein [Cynara cardunculus var. scolymus]|uniref:Tetratricopeptide, MLP1/MLP2-like protein n=1 Tax=Cynara cardunculus var. scolymus TaxID=59895 RepID=A0A103Y377_CYNCS|nr:Tetratricopeptide, MLP1/MLP2-like protein [Cynara cardunculus var. scolymus]